MGAMDGLDEDAMEAAWAEMEGAGGGGGDEDGFPGFDEEAEMMMMGDEEAEEMMFGGEPEVAVQEGMGQKVCIALRSPLFLTPPLNCLLARRTLGVGGVLGLGGWGMGAEV